MQKIITLDASQLKTFGKCPQMWAYHYQEGLSYPSGAAGSASKSDIGKQLGTAIHGLLDIYYTLQLNGAIPVADMSKAVSACQNWYDNTLWKELLSLGPQDHEKAKRLFALYVYKFSGDDMLPIVDGLEHYFEKVLYEDESRKYVLNGRIDFLGTWLGKPLFCDHKTEGKREEMYPATIQFCAYSYATGIPNGVINYIGTSAAAEKEGPFHRTMFTISDFQREQFKWYAMETFHAVEMIQGNPSHSPFSPKRELSECAGAFDKNPCMFNCLCNEGDPAMIERLKETNFIKRFWSPKQ